VFVSGYVSASPAGASCAALSEAVAET
jgi:hypothetical protein